MWPFGKVTREDQLMETALAASRGMIADFSAGGEYDPILMLPGKQAAMRDERWSRSPGCYQAKAALGWWEVAEATGDTKLREAFLETIDGALRTHREFLPNGLDRFSVMDRLHAYCYFLEALSPLLDRQDCVQAYRYALDAISNRLREIRPEFARSDVYAQLLRARVYGARAVPVDRAAAREEAAALAGFQAESDDVQIDGGFLFGRLAGVPIPHVNPVSTAFAVQALEVWLALEAGAAHPCAAPPI